MDLMIAKLLSFVLVLTRVSACFLVFPIFGSKSVPVRFRVATALLLSAFFSIIMPKPFDLAEIKLISAILLIANESVYGLAMGLIVILIFSIVKISGQMVEKQMGLSMAQVLDPTTGESGQPLGLILEMLFILLFLAANGHHILLLIISKSYQTFPVGTIPSIQGLFNGVLESSSIMLIASLRMAAPILAAFLLMMVILAVFARVVPEMNIFFISLPLRVGLGLLMITIFVPFIAEFVSQCSQIMAKLLPI
jgi:flagellar biosynthetic protein FliR